MIRVRYTYYLGKSDYEIPDYMLFKTEEEALSWIEQKKQEKIRGFKVEYIRPEEPIRMNNTPTIAPRYMYEGSTDAELLGMRY